MGAQTFANVRLRAYITVFSEIFTLDFPQHERKHQRGVSQVCFLFRSERRRRRGGRRKSLSSPNHSEFAPS